MRRPDTLLRRFPAPALILAATALLLGGCPSVSWHRAPTSTPLERAVDIECDGPYVHAGSAIEFPRRASSFVRSQPRRFDVEGNNVAVGYTCIWSDAIVEVTIYVYPCQVPPAAADREAAALELDGVLAVIERKNTDVEEVRRTEGTTSFRGATYPWATAEVTHAPGPEWLRRPVTGTATITPAGNWWIKTRTTMPQDVRDRALTAVDELLKELGLPHRPGDTRAPFGLDEGEPESGERDLDVRDGRERGPAAGAVTDRWMVPRR